MSTLHHHFRENLRRVLDETGTKRSALAERMNVSRGYVSQLIAGRNVPSLELVERVAMALEIAPHELLTPVSEKLSV